MTDKIECDTNDQDQWNENCSSLNDENQIWILRRVSKVTYDTYEVGRYLCNL